MSDRSTVSAFLHKVRGIERAHRASLRDQEERRRHAAVEARGNRRQQLLHQAHDSKLAKAQFDAACEGEVKLLNSELERRVETFQHLLTAPLGAPARLWVTPEERRKAIFSSLRIAFEPSPLDLQGTVGAPPTPPRSEDYATQIEAPTGLARIFGGRARHQKALAAATLHDNAVFAKAQVDFAHRLDEWQRRADAARAQHEADDAARRLKIERHNADVDAAEAAFEHGDLDAIVQYSLMVLDAVQWPDPLPQEARVAHASDSRHAIVEIALPTIEMMPAVREYSYVKSKREVRERSRPRAEIQALYRSVISGMTLRVLRELFDALPAEFVEAMTINGVLNTVDPATGERVRPCVVSVRVTREAFSRLQIERVDPVPCLATLGATVSKRPDELAAVRPVIEFDMVDRRFVEGHDVLDDMDTRTNIMDLNPFEFEELITNLFSKMGLEAKLTRSSRDGGVDCAAFDQRPILGGKVVVQAKRYKHTVGVGAVRDLFGTMMNEGANKGILVTTAGYGPDAFDFAKDKPIELIDGRGLLYLLEQHGVHARIIMPA